MGGCENDGHSLILVGGGGHCRAVMDVLLSLGESVAGVVDRPSIGEVFPGLRVLGGDENLGELRKKHSRALVTVGQIRTPDIRKRLYALLSDLKYEMPAFVSPLAHIGPCAELGYGSIAMHHVLIGAMARIGNNCILNSKAQIEHDVQIGDHCHIAVGAILTGGVRVGEGSFIGSGAVVREGVSIGKGCIIGMGVRVLRDVPDNVIYLGET